MRKGALLAIVIASGCGSADSGKTTNPQPSSPAQLVVLGSPGSIITLDGSRRADALAISGGAITAIGSCDELEAQIGPDTQVLRLDADHRVYPGLADAHAHLYGLGKALESVDLRGAESEEAAFERLNKAAGNLPAGTWVTGRGWDQNLWSPAKFPHAKTLDRIGDRPVAVRRVDGHALWANSRAMSIAGIGPKTPDPKGGKIIRDASGAATGVFVDTAIDLIERRIPKADRETRARRIKLAAAHVTELGLTAVHDMGIGLETADVYRELADKGELPIRVYALLSYEKGLEERLPQATVRPGLFELRAVKMFADGALGSRGAALLAPYSDDLKNTGLVIEDAKELERVGLILAKRGYQLAVHAIGDHGNRFTLDAFERVAKANPGADLRNRVEHAQILSEADIARFAELKVIASMQPTHATSDMPWAEARLGAERIRGAYAWRRLIDAKAEVAFGSDFPVEKPSPLLGVYSAVTRQDSAGKPEGGWYPEQKLTLEEALRFFTRAPAFAAFGENHRGLLRVGMAADLSIFDRELAADRSLLDRRAVATIVNGRIVHRAAAAALGRAGQAVCK